MDTLKFAKSLDCNYVNFSNLIPYPGTEAFDWAQENANFVVDKNQAKENIIKELEEVKELLKR